MAEKYNVESAEKLANEAQVKNPVPKF